MSKGIITIQSNVNNTIITLAQFKPHRVLSVRSSGILGFKGSRKSTSYAGELVGEQIRLEAKKHGITHIKIQIKGFGDGRYSSLKALQVENTLQIISIKDITPIAFAGCRPKKQRRI